MVKIKKGTFVKCEKKKGRVFSIDKTGYALVVFYGHRSDTWEKKRKHIAPLSKLSIFDPNRKRGRPPLDLDGTRMDVVVPKNLVGKLDEKKSKTAQVHYLLCGLAGLSEEDIRLVVESKGKRPIVENKNLRSMSPGSAKLAGKTTEYTGGNYGSKIDT